MKKICLIPSVCLAAVLAGCASTPVAVAPVGPNPAAPVSQAANGRLQVFSRLVGCTEGNNPTWYQHTGYGVYDVKGKLVRRVDNTVGHYEQAPRVVALPAGKYVVKAQANDYLQVAVPVTIEDGRITRVHLDDQWQAPASPMKAGVVSLPNGRPVGWRAAAAGTGSRGNQLPEG